MKKIKLDENTIAKISKDSYAFFYSAINSDKIIDVIKDFIMAGVSPVAKTARRYAKYSSSYKDFLKGKVRFFKSGGSTIAYYPKKKKFPLPFEGKNPTKVNLYATGDMLKSMFIKGKTKSVVIGFKDEKAVYHNETGAGKSKVIRRLLPTNSGEKFIKNIDDRLKRLGKEAIAKALNKNKTKLKIMFVMKNKF